MLWWKIILVCYILIVAEVTQMRSSTKLISVKQLPFCFYVGSKKQENLTSRQYYVKQTLISKVRDEIAFG